MSRELAVRVSCLYAPIAIAGALWLFRFQAGQLKPSPRRVAAGMLLAAVWTLVTLIPIQAAATSHGWWTFGVDEGLFLEMPLDLYIGWIVLWSAVPIVAFPNAGVLGVAAVMFTVDLVVMPLCAPVVRLGDAWYVGEIVAVGSALVPAQYLARWTIQRRHLHGRAVFQVVAFTGLLLFVIPGMVFERVGGSWSVLLNRTTFWNSVLLQLLAFPAIVGLSAVQEFVVRGGGTPIPYDPPQRLVTTGPYSYVSNPMQLSAAVALVLWGVMLGSFWVAASGLMAVAYGAGLASWHEGEQLQARFGEPWARYRHDVRAWRPRWRPYTSGTARLYVAQTCLKCRGVGAWLIARRPVGVEVIAAEAHPRRVLVRMTYEPAFGGRADEGIAAFARALEHLHLGWALLGLFIRLPGVRPVLQLLVDASGGAPMRVERATLGTNSKV